MFLSADGLSQELGIVSQRINILLTRGLGQNKLQEGAEGWC